MSSQENTKGEGGYDVVTITVVVITILPLKKGRAKQSNSIQTLRMGMRHSSALPVGKRSSYTYGEAYPTAAG
jgi:hypothetical protein